MRRISPPESVYALDKFLARTLLYNRRMNEAIDRLGLERVNVGEFSSLGDAVSRVLFDANAL